MRLPILADLPNRVLDSYILQQVLNVRSLSAEPLSAESIAEAYNDGSIAATAFDVKRCLLLAGRHIFKETWDAILLHGFEQVRVHMPLSLQRFFLQMIVAFGGYVPPSIAHRLLQSSTLSAAAWPAWHGQCPTPHHGVHGRSPGSYNALWTSGSCTPNARRSPAVDALGSLEFTPHSSHSSHLHARHSASIPSSPAIEHDDPVEALDMSTLPTPSGADSVATPEHDLSPRTGSVTSRHERDDNGHSAFAPIKSTRHPTIVQAIAAMDVTHQYQPFQHHSSSHRQSPQAASRSGSASSSPSKASVESHSAGIDLLLHAASVMAPPPAVRRPRISEPVARRARPSSVMAADASEASTPSVVESAQPVLAEEVPASPTVATIAADASLFESNIVCGVWERDASKS